MSTQCKTSTAHQKVNDGKHACRFRCLLFPQSVQGDKKGLNENAHKCLFNGGVPPLGYDIDQNQRYVINTKEAEIVKLIFKLYIEGIGYKK